MTDTTTDTPTTDTAEIDDAIYRLEDVQRVFSLGGGEVRAVDGLDLQINRGEFVAIEGSSGSGKSTLLQLLGGLDRPTSGSLLLSGKELSKLNDRALTQVRSRDIGFVFQHFNLIPTLTALENVETAMVPLKISRSERVERATSLLEDVGLGHRLKHPPSLLSGGEQQRVAIARALANQPSVILADEPTGNLDSSTADEVVAILGRLSSEKNVTVVLVTHAPDVAQRASRRLRMRDGKFQAEA